MIKLCLALVAALAVTAGCSNTAKGVAEDTKSNIDKASETVEEGGAAALTPRIKSAIVADSELNDDKNQIDVDTTEEKVELKGHVATAELRAKAEKIARDVMKKAEAKQELVNSLEVTQV